jgi:hypothetical protein
MDTVETDRLVDDYLRRLERAAAHLPRARRSELVEEIRDHIETALGEEQPVDEVAVRNVLDRLGSPEEIAEAAEPRPAERRVGALEIVALIGLLIPVIGWLVGMALALASRVWSRRDKGIAILLLLVPIVVLGLGFVATGPSRTAEAPPPSQTQPVDTEEEAPAGPGAVELVSLVAGMPSAVYLAWRLRRDPTA